MCGRFVIAASIDDLSDFFDARQERAIERAFRPSFNVAPTDDALCLVGSHDDRLLDVFRWGLIPSWSSDRAVGNRMFNARAETVATKPSFRDAFRSRRLAVLVDGFYEWRRDGARRRQPFYLSRADGAPMAFAGLWDSWRDPTVEDDGARLRTCTIVTTVANAEVAPIHERMPVLLERDALDVWLENDGANRDEVEALLKPAPSETLVAHAVDSRVGNARVNDPRLIDPVEDGKLW